MPRPASVVRNPHARLEASIRAEEGLDEAIRQHLASVVRQDMGEAKGTPVLHRCARVTVLRLYARTLMAEPDLLTLTRVTGEVLRGLRALGMLRVGRSLMPAKPGREIFSAPRKRSSKGIPRWTNPPPDPVGDDEDGDDDLGGEGTDD